MDLRPSPQGDSDASRWVGDSFLQVNTALGDALRDFVLLRAQEANQVVDAYCGVGAYARELARRGAKVTGIEVDPAACAAALTDAPDTLSIVQGRVEERLAAVLPTDLLILNPPRSGVHDSGAGRHPRIRTRPRDLRELRPGYAGPGRGPPHRRIHAG